MFTSGAPAGGYCAVTCNRCPPDTSPSPTPNPSLSPGSTPVAGPAPTCNDTPPDSRYTCQEQASYGKCGEPFMFGAGAPEGGYCAASCNRCPPGTLTPSQPGPSSPAASPVVMGSPGMTSPPAATMAASPVPVTSPAVGSPSPYYSASPASPSASPVQAVSPTIGSPPPYSAASPVASPASASPGSSPAAVPVCVDVAGPFNCAQQVSSSAMRHDTMLPSKNVDKTLHEGTYLGGDPS